MRLGSLDLVLGLLILGDGRVVGGVVATHEMCLQPNPGTHRQSNPKSEQ